MRVFIITLNTVISWSMKLALAGMLVYAVFMELDAIIIFSAALFLLCSLLPSILNRSFEITLPWIVDFWVTLAVFLHIVGITFNFYHDPAWEHIWDKLVHFSSTALIAMLGFFVIFTLHFVKKVKMSIPMIGFFTYMFSIAIGALWEVIEYYSDYFIGTRAIRSIDDTIHDIVIDALGGAVAALLGMLYVRRQKRHVLSKTLRPIARILVGKSTSRI